MVNPLIDDFSYAAVYEGDVFKYGIKNGKKTVLEHEQELGNVDKKASSAPMPLLSTKRANPCAPRS